MSNPLSETSLGATDDPFVRQIDPFLEALEPFKDPVMTNVTPYADLELYQSHLDRLAIPQDISQYEDALCKQMTELELNIESLPIKESAALPASLSPHCFNAVSEKEYVIKNPLKGGYQEGPPHPQNTWMGIKEPIPPGFGRIRPSRAGARSPSDVFCELRGERIESSECDCTCEYYDHEIQVCRYGDDQRSAEEESSG